MQFWIPKYQFDKKTIFQAYITVAFGVIKKKKEKQLCTVLHFIWSLIIYKKSFHKLELHI